MRLQRTQLGARGKPTLGKLTSRDGKFSCLTLERPADCPDHPCVPPGDYAVTLDWHHPSDLEKRYMCPELQDVPGRSQIQIHIFNDVEESLGCIAPGERYTRDKLSIELSRYAFERLMKYLEGAKMPFTLEIRNP